MRRIIVVDDGRGGTGGCRDARWPARLRAQAPQADTPTFEVASVKPNKSGEGFVQLGGRGGQFTITNAPLRLIIRNAYRLQDFQIIGGPGWLNSDRFDIVAKSDPTATQDQTQAMIKALLAERFKLKVHTESRDLPLYALHLARSDGKLGPQIKTAAVDCAALAAARRGGPPPPGAGGPGGPGAPLDRGGLDRSRGRTRWAGRGRGSACTRRRPRRSERTGWSLWTLRDADRARQHCRQWPADVTAGDQPVDVGQSHRRGPDRSHRQLRPGAVVDAGTAAAGAAAIRRPARRRCRRSIPTVRRSSPPCRNSSG